MEDFGQLQNDYWECFHKKKQRNMIPLLKVKVRQAGCRPGFKS